MAKKKAKVTGEEKVIKERSRVHMVLLYPDDETHVKALETIKKEYDHAYILHDKDVEEETGELKKPHWHVVLRFGEAVWNSSVAKNLGIKCNYVRKNSNINKALEYLIHFNNPDKMSYEIEEVHGNLRTKLAERLKANEKTEGEKVVDVIQYIQSLKRPIGIAEFAMYCAESGQWDVFRRSASIFINIIGEHNMKFTKKGDNICNIFE